MPVIPLGAGAGLGLGAAAVLNPDADSPLNPDYVLPLPPLPDPLVYLTRSGQPYARRLEERGRVISMTWAGRSFANASALRQWHHRYRGGFFSFYHVESGRYFSGRFRSMQGPVQNGFEDWAISADFEELPHLALYAYPTGWAADAIFLEERDDFGVDRGKATGVWTFAANANAHGGSEMASANTNTTDLMEILYYGYGFRLWARQADNLGILALSCESGADSSVVELAPANVDLYAAAPAASAFLYTKSDLKLGLHRVKLAATNTKNAGSSAKTIVWDALEIMQ